MADSNNENEVVKLISLSNLDTYTGYIEKKSVPLTYEQYDLLPSTKLTNGITYFITDRQVMYKNGILYGTGGGEANVQANWTESDTDSDAYIRNKPTLGTAASKDSTTSITQNSNDLITSGAVYTGLSGKVDTVSGKGLSTNDYTTTEKTKLSGIKPNANNVIKTQYTLSANSWTAGSAGVYYYSLSINNPTLDVDFPVNVYFAEGHDASDDMYYENTKFNIFKNIYNGEYGGSVVDYPTNLILYYYDPITLNAPSTSINIYVEGVVINI